jgi:putative long chain acyl-CoA synthase
MPRGLWRRVQERFYPARVLEFYASTETGAILVNLRDAKPGAMGRPLPGTPEVRIAAYDQESEQLILGRGGFVRQCKTDEVGLLVARARPSDTSVAPMRGVFSRDDAWLSTGDLFRRDADGDYWRLDGVYDVIHTAEGPVLAAPMRDALSELPAVDLAIAYGLRVSDAPAELAVAAVTLRPAHTINTEALTRALAALPDGHRPAIVHVIDEMPVTTWFRPITRPLRRAGLPEPAPGRAWYLDRSGRRYRPLTQAARKRLSRR